MATTSDNKTDSEVQEILEGLAELPEQPRPRTTIYDRPTTQGEYVWDDNPNNDREEAQKG